MGLNIDLLEKSFQLVAPKGKELTEKFYQILFEDYPEVKPLFKNNNAMKLLESLAFIVGNIRNQDKVVSYLRDLGKTHKSFKVKEEDYPKVGASLLKTLEEFAGDAWNDEIKTTWTDAYGLIQTTMLEGAK